MNSASHEVTLHTSSVHRGCVYLDQRYNAIRSFISCMFAWSVQHVSQEICAKEADRSPHSSCKHPSQYDTRLAVMPAFHYSPCSQPWHAWLICMRLQVTEEFTFTTLGKTDSNPSRFWMSVGVLFLCMRWLSTGMPQSCLPLLTCKL